MPLNPLDLFTSESNNNNRDKRESSVYKPSSPIQETKVIQEIKLQEEHESLLELRNKLKQEVLSLENEWNALQSTVEANSLKSQNEENDLIFQLLLQKSTETKAEKDTDAAQEDEKQDDTHLMEFSPHEFTTAPLKNWDLRIEFLKKLYPYLTIVDPSSRVSLAYDSNNKPNLIKTISFKLYYGKLFKFEVDLKLKNENNAYSIADLSIVKRSNNRFNTIILQIIEYHTLTKNINEFLYTINELHEMLTDRQKSLEELYKEYYPEDEPQTSKALSSIKFGYKDIELSWDILFDKTSGSLDYLILINSQYSALFLDLMKLYGVTGGVRKLIEGLYE